jgi:hypothetical protein
MNQYIAYAAKSWELHRKLNDWNYEGDIDAEYRAFFDEYAALREKTYKVLVCPSGPFGLHDCVVSNFSERKRDNFYHSSFKDSFYTEDNKLHAYYEFVVKIKSKSPIREIANKTIYDFMYDPDTKQLLVIYHRNWQGNHKNFMVTVEEFSIETKRITLANVGR